MKRFKPKIIGITGNVGKTSSKDAIFAALSNSLHIRKNQKSFNSEIGVPLTVLGLQNGYGNFGKWITNIIDGFLVLFSKKYPEWLVLELGVDHPGDMRYLMKWIKLDIAVFTRFPSVPVHVEYFNSPKDVINEKKQMLKGLKPDGFVVLNADDEKVLEIKEETKNKVITYGIKNDADIKVSNDEILYDSKSTPIGINFKVDYKSNSIPFNVNGVLGKQHIYPIIIALACGSALDIQMVEMSTSLRDYFPAGGRMNLLKGINDSVIIDDTYNASPVAMQEAIKTLGRIDFQKTKIAVLSDMSEIGRYTAHEHKIIGKMVFDNKIDLLLTHGKRSEFIHEEAILSGMSEKNALHFSDKKDLIAELKNRLSDGVSVLVKGSQIMRMEQVIKEIMEEKGRANELLVRQDSFWLNKD